MKQKRFSFRLGEIMECLVQFERSCRLATDRTVRFRQALKR
jgi:hypothetical protein